MKAGKSNAVSRKPDSRLSVKKQTKKEKQAAKDPNKPKRAASAFFVFMEGFRKEYKEKHPNNKSVAAVGKAGGDEWKSMSKEDKAPFVAVAEQRKEEYERQMRAYNKKLAGEELATKAVSNFYRSPDMGDSFEFCIDFKTPLQKIGHLKEEIKRYLERNYHYWHPNHNVVVKEIEDVNKIKMALFFNHTMNFQDYGEKSRRRTELVLEMKRIFEDLGISYDLLPQKVHLIDSKTDAAES